MIRRKTQTQAKKPSTPALKPISTHLAELRTRLGIVFLFFIVAASLAYVVREQIVGFILAPINGEKLVYLTPGGGFTFIFQVAIYTGILFTAPLAVYHLYKFIAPALSNSIRHRTFWLILSSTLLMIGGVLFGYYLAIPGALHFLTNFADGLIVSNLTADSYLNFIAAYLLGLGLMFQLPLLLILWNTIFPIKPGGLMSSQRFVIVGAFIAAAIITPTPDVVNQALIALPIIFIYQIGVIAVWMTNRQTRKVAERATSNTLPTITPVTAPVPAPVAIPEQHVTQPAKQLPTPRPAPIAIAPPRPRRTVDGFVPRRPTNPTRVLNQMPQQLAGSPRSRRSVDGIISTRLVN